MVDLPTEAEPVRVVEGDNLDVLPTLQADSFDSIVSDPPYALGEPRSGSDWKPGQCFAPRTEEMKARRRGGFMGKEWDAELPGIDHWQAALRVLKPGGYAAIFGGTRTYHRLACAVEDAGFEIRDCLMWMYGTGFPKGQGCLKPAWEPILLARKPGPRVLPLGIDACRVPTDEFAKPPACDSRKNGVSRENYRMPNGGAGGGATSPLGRYPANVVHDGSEEVLEAFAAFGEKTSGSGKRRPRPTTNQNTFMAGWPANDYEREGDSGSAARFFYCAKASKAERAGSKHPTVKPLKLCEWLVRLVTPPGGLVLDPFTGSGSIGVACVNEGMRFVGIERESEYVADANRRIAAALREQSCSLFAG